jgi:hypothetical protein
MNAFLHLACIKGLIAAVGFGILVGCGHTNTPSDDDVIGSYTTTSGSAVAARLQALYDDTRKDCGTPSAPAFLCSGVTLRVTRQDNSYHVWDPSPTSVRTGGIHFSYLRADSNFREMAWSDPKTNSNGYVFYPIFDKPADKLHIEYLCVFPIDGWAWYRSAPGCGPSTDYPTQSRRCQSIGITTAELWIKHWNTPNIAKPSLHQCSFDIRDAMNNLGADSFYQSIRAKQQLGQRGFNEQNDLILAAWPAGQQNKLPIMALFYIAGSPAVALADAKWNQRDFYNWTSPRIVVPIIKVTLPTTVTGRARFEYIEADQVHK